MPRFDLTQDPQRSQLGPLAPALEDPEVTCLLADGCARLWIERRWTLEPVTGAIDAASLESLIAALAQHLDLPPDQPLIQATLEHGVQVVVLRPPLAAEPQLAIHLPLRQTATFAQLVDADVIPQIAARLLAAAVAARRGILVAAAAPLPGAMVLASLAALCPPSERVVAIELEAPLAFEHPRRVTVRLAGCDAEQRGAVCTAAGLLRPDRVVLAGLDPVSARWLLETAPGTPGVLGLVPAGDSRVALQALEAAAVSGGLAREAVSPLIAAAFSLVVTLGRLPDGRIAVWRIAELVAGAGVPRLRDLYLTTQADDDQSAVPVLVPTGLVPTFLPSLAPFGVAIEASHFACETHGLPLPAAGFDGCDESPARSPRPAVDAAPPERPRSGRSADLPAPSLAPASPARSISPSDDPGWEVGMLPDPPLPEVDEAAAARLLRPARPAVEPPADNAFGVLLRSRRPAEGAVPGRVSSIERVPGVQRYVPQPPPMHPQAHHLHLEPPPPTTPPPAEPAAPVGSKPGEPEKK
ncbi:MAG: Flp pilus assembly complex ATPase component TadA [Deltaproteobacteria bacterium]|nr:Flp pilus assembly complex ATPase component TadA [Deltaproteobacteria bacterium]